MIVYAENGREKLAIGADFMDLGDYKTVLTHKITDEDVKIEWIFKSARMSYNIEFTDSVILLEVPTSDITRIEY